MQTVSRYLLSQLVIAYVSGYHGRNSQVYDRRITLHRGVSNPLNFTFKNEDQKAQDIVGKEYELNIIDSESKKSVITKTLTIVDDGSSDETAEMLSRFKVNSKSHKIAVFLDEQ